ncbi:hypothetical protein X975_11482, partial [Stegodyphus mimosarum]
MLSNSCPQTPSTHVLPIRAMIFSSTSLNFWAEGGPPPVCKVA